MKKPQQFFRTVFYLLIAITGSIAWPLQQQDCCKMVCPSLKIPSFAANVVCRRKFQTRLFFQNLPRCSSASTSNQPDDSLKYTFVSSNQNNPRIRQQQKRRHHHYYFQNKHQHNKHVPSMIRLLGSKAGVDGNPPGEVMVENHQDILTVNQDRLHTTLHKIRDILGYSTYDVALYLVEDEFMQQTNLETRGMDKPTDILSFPMLEAETPGVLQEPDFDIPDYYNLGDLIIDVPYVIRQCEEDAAVQNGDDEYDDGDRGVSGAMATVFDTEERIHMLLVHGMLHLVGYDHENDHDYELMVSKEEEILKQLGNDTKEGLN